MTRIRTGSSTRRAPARLMLLTLAMLIVTTTVTACGVPAQDDPDAIESRPPLVQRRVDGVPPETGTPVTVYFIRESRLVPVTRAGSVDPSPSSAQPQHRDGAAQVMRWLHEGPTDEEARTGVRTALPPDAVSDDPPAVSTDGVADVAAGTALARVAGADQLLAFAQLVFTVTESPGVDEVRVVLNGRAIAVPTDSGLRTEPVGREDYVSVAPP